MRRSPEEYVLSLIGKSVNVGQYSGHISIIIEVEL